MVSRERVFGQRELKAPPLYVSLCTPSRARKSLASSAPFRANVEFRAQPMRATESNSFHSARACRQVRSPSTGNEQAGSPARAGSISSKVRDVASPDLSAPARALAARR